MNKDPQTFLANLQAAPKMERPRLLLEHTLVQLPDKLSTAVLAAAVPHWFDYEFLNALLDGNQALDTDEFTQLTELSFVESFPERGWNIHEFTRKLLLDKIWRKTKEKYRETSRRAYAYCQGQNLEDTVWRIEMIYHLLIHEPDQGTDVMHDMGSEWQNTPNFAYDKVETMVLAASEHAEAGRMDPNGLNALLFWGAHLDRIYSRAPQAKAKLHQLDLGAENNVLRKANCIQALGDVHNSLSEHKQAREKYEQARLVFREINVKNGEAGCFNSLAIMLLKKKNYVEALAVLDRAIAVFPDATYFSNRAEPHMALGKYAEAERDLVEAARLNPNAPYLLFNQGRLALWQEQIERALGFFQQALEINPLHCEFNLWQAFALCAFGRMDQAQKQLARGIAVCYQRWEVQEALEAVERLKEVYPERDWETLARGLEK